jgi:hypothetical protein
MPRIYMCGPKCSTWIHMAATCPPINNFIPYLSQHILLPCHYGIPDCVFEVLYGLEENLWTRVCVKKINMGRLICSLKKKHFRMDSEQKITSRPNRFPRCRHSVWTRKTTVLHMFQISVTNDSADISQSSFNTQNLFSEVSCLRIFNRRNFQFESTSFPINVLIWVLKRCYSCGSQPNCTRSTCNIRIFNHFPFMSEVLVSSYSPMLPFKLSSKIPPWFQLHALLWYSDDLQSFSIPPPISVFYEFQYYDWRFN